MKTKLLVSFSGMLFMLMALISCSGNKEANQNDLIGTWNVAVHNIQPYISAERKNKSLDHINTIKFLENDAVEFSETIKGHTKKERKKYEISQNSILIKEGDGSIIFTFSYELTEDKNQAILKSEYHRMKLIRIK